MVFILSECPGQVDPGSLLNYYIISGIDKIRLKGYSWAKQIASCREQNGAGIWKSYLWA